MAFSKKLQSNPDQKLTGSWNEYNWKYQEKDITNLKGLKNLEGKDYNFSIGLLEESKKSDNLLQSQGR
ncbi:MAG: hypothetical protein IPP15_00990 [Saprospiraceae bacterium]|uniref:Uncharacterized protein n=1 Tax=Candidatus Opimibacter skivensis TaxID=2982028 RepID=A0A9D7XMB6_9BACT|nr:hypothetical protein [Candidatus Opimibacter skivensis]